LHFLTSLSSNNHALLNVLECALLSSHLLKLKIKKYNMNEFQKGNKKLFNMFGRDGKERE
jgi:hypothetical protein